MGAGSNIGSFFGGFGEAIGGNLLSYEKEKRARKHDADMVSLDVWTKILTNPKEPYNRRRVAAEQVAKATGNKNIAGLADLFPHLMDEEGLQQPGPNLSDMPTRPRQVFPALGQTRPRTVGASIEGQPISRPRTVGLGGGPDDTSQWTGQQPPGMTPGMGGPTMMGMPGQQQNPIYPSITKGRQSQAPDRLITPMPKRPPQSDWEMEQVFQMGQMQEMERFRTEENIRQAQAQLEMKQKAEAGELGQLASLVDGGNGEAAAVYVNPINGQRTQVPLGKPINEINQKIQFLRDNPQIKLSADEAKQWILDIRPTGPQAVAAQDAQDWIDSKSPDPNVAGPAQLRLQEKGADLQYKQIASANMASQIQDRGREKKAQAGAVQSAIFIFDQRYKQAYIQRQAQKHLQELQQLGEAAVVGDPEIASLIGANRGNPQALATAARKMAEKDAQQYYAQLIALMKDDGSGPRMVHIEQLRKEAAMAQAKGANPNDVWEFYKSLQESGNAIIVDDDLNPWTGEPSQSPFSGAGAAGSILPTPPSRPAIGPLRPR